MYNRPNLGDWTHVVVRIDNALVVPFPVCMPAACSTTHESTRSREKMAAGEYPENLLPCERFYGQDWCSVWPVYVSEHSSVNLTPALYEEKYRANNCVI